MLHWGTTQRKRTSCGFRLTTAGEGGASIRVALAGEHVLGMHESLDKMTRRYRRQYAERFSPAPSAEMVLIASDPSSIATRTLLCDNAGRTPAAHRHDRRSRVATSET